MNATSTFASPKSILVFSAAVLAGVIATGLLSAVVLLFQSRGVPLERLVAAERACAQLIYLSERETCMKQWLAERRATSVAAQ